MARFSGLARIFGLAAVVSLRLAASAGDAAAYEVKRTTRGELVHWDERAVSYTIDASIERAVSRGHDATASALEGWSGTVGAPDLHAGEPGPESATKPGFDRKNGVFFIPNGYAPAGRALAITVLTYDNGNGRILDADIVFNGAYTFAVLGPSGEHAVPRGRLVGAAPTDGIDRSHEDEEPQRIADTVYDLHHVVAHELGHSLGMNDEMGRRDALMYRYSAPNDATLRQPASDDIAGLAELYGTRLEARGNGCASSVAPRRTPAAAGSAAVVATLALLAFIILRARSDRRARLAFVAASAASLVALVPSLEGSSARASESTVVGHARARVSKAETAIEDGLFRTHYALTTTRCNVVTCPRDGQGTTWGGTIGPITQEVDGHFAPVPGDEVDVSFAKLPTTLAALQPLTGRTLPAPGDVRILTRAR